MALQICPSCKEESFTWFMTEDDSGKEVTGWGCHSCHFLAIEHERYNDDGSYRFETFKVSCPGCGSAKDIKLHKDGRSYLWCSHCAALIEQPA
jgi:transposase-like protein